MNLYLNPIAQLVHAADQAHGKDLVLDGNQDLLLVRHGLPVPHQRSRMHITPGTSRTAICARLVEWLRITLTDAELAP